MTEEHTTPFQDPNQTSDKSVNSNPEQALAADLEKMTLTAQRALADLSNYKQQVAKERQMMAQMSQIRVLEQFFPIIDNFNLAVKQTPEAIQSDNWYKGIQNIHKMLNKITTDMGLEAIGTESLDSNLHEVISVIPGEKDQIIETLEQGYKLGDKVVRPSKVVVGSGE